LHPVTKDSPQQDGTQQGALRFEIFKTGYCPHTKLLKEHMTEQDLAEKRNFICANKSNEAHRIVNRAGDNYHSC
jgi:hypothetical protein